MAITEPDHGHKEEEAVVNEDEDTGAQVAPIVKLKEVAVSSGEENEDAILDLKSKLYRFDKDGNQWKERGVGTVKLLKHKKTGKVRLVMRQSKTLKICANHLVLPAMTVQEHAGNEKSCLWYATDFSDGELKEELFCIRFGSIENRKTFMDKFKEAAESQQKEEESKATSETAERLEKLAVEEKKPDEAPKSQKEEKSKAASETAEHLEKLAVEEKKPEEKAESQQEEESKAASEAAELLEKLAVEEKKPEENDEDWVVI